MTGHGAEPSQHPPGDGLRGEECAQRPRTRVPDPVIDLLHGGPGNPGMSYSGAEGESPCHPLSLTSIGFHLEICYCKSRIGCARTLLHLQCLQRHCLQQQHSVHSLGANTTMRWVKSNVEVMTDCKPMPDRPVGTSYVCIEKFCDGADYFSGAQRVSG